MIGKGFDIPNVSLVGVILADLGLHIPDFRASERSFQLLTQVAGRAGRRKKQGQVVIQTYSPDHTSIVMTENHDFIQFFEQEIDSRQHSKLPPFGKLIKLAYVSENSVTCQSQALSLQEKLQNLDPTKSHDIYAAPALIPRISRKYHWHVLIQGPYPRKLLKQLQETDPEALSNWRIDVDPVHTV
jgi:primosomal protein N' (replication factor Y)